VCCPTRHAQPRPCGVYVFLSITLERKRMHAPFTYGGRAWERQGGRACDEGRIGQVRA
jgi:hypothetical protein